MSQSAGVLLPILKLEGIVYDDVKGAAVRCHVLMQTPLRVPCAHVCAVRGL